MVLAAGLGKRMRPITDTMPKPLVSVAGKPLIDWTLDALEEAGVERVVVNVHYLAPMMRAHLAIRQKPEILVSDESDQLLDSGGGIVRALPLLGTDPFLILNADTFWVDSGRPNLARLAEAWNPSAMDMMMLVADPARATGHTGGGDFLLDTDGRLERARGRPDAVIYAGAAITTPALFEGMDATTHSLNLHFDRLIAAGRLYGLALEGEWITVGTPEAIAPAEAAVARARALAQ